MKENIEKSVNYLNKLKEVVGETWKQKLDNFLKDEEVELDDDIKDCIIDFIMALREEIMENRTANLKEVEKKIDNDLLFKNLRDYMDDLLETFYDFAPLRSFYAKNPDETSDIMEQIFEQTILRFNHDILQEYEKYGFDRGEAFADFLNSLENICTYVVKKNMYYNAIEDFLYSQTRLPKSLCKKLTDLIDSNFESMKLNYIIDKLNRMEE